MDGKSLSDCFLRASLVYGKKIAISFLREGTVETEISYLDLDKDSNKMANTFLNMGVEKGDRIILCLEKSLIFVVACLALHKIGAVSVPLNPGSKKSEISYLVNDVRPKLILAGTQQSKLIKEISDGIDIIEINAGRAYQNLDFFRSASDNINHNLTGTKIESKDPGLIIYTSGTTGKPKGAVLTQKNLVHDAENIIDIWEITESDRLCHALPLFHVHGLCFALHTALMTGSHVVMIDQFSPEKVIEVLTEKDKNYSCTIFMAVPSMYGKMMDYLKGKKPDFEHIRLWASGSAPLLIKDFKRIKKIFGKEPVEREGMTETGMNFSNPLRGVKKPGSIGLPLPDLKVRIVDIETLTDAAPFQEGEIWLKGSSITPGYWQKPEETARAFENGWFKTGDLGKVDKDGYYYLTDRCKNIIVSGGENISPKEVEDVINQLKDVLESSVFGILDKKWGEKAVSAVVLKPGARLSSDAIKNYCKENLLNWKCPKDVLFLKELPKNSMGKVLKEELKELFKKMS